MGQGGNPLAPMTPGCLDHAANARGPGIACLRMTHLLPGFQSLVPGAIVSRADLNCSVHTPNFVCGLGWHWKGLGCAVTASTCTGTESLAEQMELRGEDEDGRPGVGSLGSLPIPPSSTRGLRRIQDLEIQPGH